MNSKRIYLSAIIVSVLSAMGATACCVLPLALVTVGLGGAWMASIRSLESFQSIFIALTVISMGYAFYTLYLRPKQCVPGDSCASPVVQARQQIAFWMALASILLLVVVYAFIYLMG